MAEGVGKSRIPSFCALVTIFLGAFSLSGWIFDIPFGRSIIPHNIAIMPNSALGFVLAGSALWLRRNRGPWSRPRAYLSLFFICICIAIGGLTLVEYVLGVDLGIDEIIAVQGPGMAGTVKPGRMSVYSATNFVLNGFALLWVDRETKRGQRPAQYLSIATIIAPLHAALGYAYGVHDFLNFGSSTLFMHMAPGAALCWILLSVGTGMARPESWPISVFTSPTLAGRFVRRLLFPVLAIPPFLGWVIATGEPFRTVDPGLGASVLALVSILVFMAILWRNGYELLRVSSERDQALENLRQATVAAEEANLAKSAFLANMSHEIRSPIGVMLGFSELMACPNSSPESRARYADIMQRNGKALLAIINDILDLSKVEAGKLKIERERFDVFDLVEDLARVHETLARQKGLDFRLVWDGKIPAEIESDPVRIRQVLTNLLSNAIKFTEQGEVFLRVRTAVADPVHRSVRLAFEVGDTGPGISPEVQARLFHPFEQGDSSQARRYGGAGLGLALSLRLAKAMRGSLEIKKTEVGAGTLLEFTVAASVPEGIAFEDALISFSERVPSTSAPEVVGQRRLAGMKVLVVDDSADNRLLISLFLALEGVEIELATNGQEAIQKASARSYDVILMDIQMPNMDGLQATEILRDRGYDGPIIALTAHAMQEHRERALRAGLDAHVAKPVQHAELIAVLERYANTRMLREA